MPLVKCLRHLCPTVPSNKACSPRRNATSWMMEETTYLSGKVILFYRFCFLNHFSLGIYQWKFVQSSVVPVPLRTNGSFVNLIKVWCLYYRKRSKSWRAQSCNDSCTDVYSREKLPLKNKGNRLAACHPKLFHLILLIINILLCLCVPAKHRCK